MSQNRANDKGQEPARIDVAANERGAIARELQAAASPLIETLQHQLAQLRRINDPKVGPLIDECDRTIAEIRSQLMALKSDAD